MSIFNDHVSDSGDNLVEKCYNLEWDWIGGNKIIKGLFPKKDESGIYYKDPERKQAYYSPAYIFYTYLSKSLASARANARAPKKNKGGCRGVISLSKLDESNLRLRFNKMIKECSVLMYKDTEYILTDPYDGFVYSLKNRIMDMMYNYITTETYNSKYFRHIHKK
jgi:hypothetical protein